MTANAAPTCIRIGPLSVRRNLRAVLVSALLLGAIVAVALVSLGTGDFPISIGRVASVLLGGGDSIDRLIVMQLRLERVVTALAVGGCLGIAGCLFQSLTRNPLGSPDVVGFSSGSATGALVVILLWGGSTAQVQLGAVAGGVATALVVSLLAIRRGFRAID